jgi:hypothetical protein
MRKSDEYRVPGIEDKADLGICLWERLMWQLIHRGIVDAEALDSIMNISFSPNSAELVSLRDSVHARLRQAVPTLLQLADRDGVPQTED